MVDYKELTDFSINCLVAALRLDDRMAGKLPNYCNSPTEAMPLIIENRIGIIPSPENGKWKAAHRSVGGDNTPHFMNESTNPLRAAMIVYLMIKDGENDGN